MQQPGSKSSAVPTDATPSAKARFAKLVPLPTKHTGLFREQAISAHARRLEGEILIIQPPSVDVMLGILAVFALVAIAFLCTATYARTERVTGYLVPRGGVSTILPVRPGVVSEVLVRAGDSVRAGDVLLRVTSRSALQDGSELEAGLGDSLRAQKTVLETKLELVATTASVSQRKMRADLGELDQRLVHLRRLESLARDRLDLARKRQQTLTTLLEKDIVSEKDQQEQVDKTLGLEAELRHAQYSILQQEESRRALESALTLEPTERAADQADLEIQILSLESHLRELEGRQAYALISPISGRVASLQAAPGTDVSPDVPVAIVIPDDGQLEAHLLVPTRAAGLIALDQSVGIDLAAFPARTFGVRTAHIQRIDTAVLAPGDVQGPVKVEEPVYRVVAGLDGQVVDAFGRSYPLQPGMSFDADITLETRSFIAWILEPLYGPSRVGGSAS